MDTEMKCDEDQDLYKGGVVISTGVMRSAELLRREFGKQRPVWHLRPPPGGLDKDERNEAVREKC